ncbi:putative membrane protein YeiB [Mesonia hippocampi]|uniref:Putative membrane protein YeiB n=1 Tax=Mesonia hippocampi TaxID=1628250 RepID=A0A840EU65_9FLAO|nr:heparan-alpha-glucosaminide N-acetyltransferase domain-containing protein [Mesonia hippocampi]MBB4119006.1 putative membrane protein YeiB [Mesonia hippocampi]
MEQRKRIIGFDLARAYAIFGMFVVNFNMVFGNFNDTSWSSQLLTLFSGNSSTLFVLLAGMGTALMTNRQTYSEEEENKLRKTILKRALFLFVLGLLLALWWPADILHFYGGYMTIAALIVFLNKKYFIWATAFSIVLFHIMLVFIPYETGWDFDTLQYNDLWTINGFTRNLFYNGWNSMFPWLAYFTLGMYLGRLDWSKSQVQKKTSIVGGVIYFSIVFLQVVVNQYSTDKELLEFINADYLPPFLPFLLSTIGIGLMLIAFFMYISKFIEEKSIVRNIAKTGQMTLTHYILHLTLGVILLEWISGKEYSPELNFDNPIHPLLIALYSIIYFVLSYYFSKLWGRKFKYGPFEMLMRSVSN